MGYQNLKDSANIENLFNLLSNLWAGLSSTGYWLLTFLTSTPSGDAKIYQTHNQWTSDGQWLIFRSNRVKGEAMAVNENTGEMVQVVEVDLGKLFANGKGLPSARTVPAWLNRK